jgi:GAF domain
MDHYSILDHSPASPADEAERVRERELPKPSPRSATASVSAGIAAANAHLPKLAQPAPRFPGEDGGRSLAEMAYADLDAALQLLADRAQYITGSSGAAIALRRGQHNDMLCRATVGANAPELGALLSMEYGLSGECVRTRQPLRCDDAERDPRVNHEVCRELGIASVVVMPIVSDEHVLGVFELFSGKPHAFAERDLSALQRLSEMVETAVKYAMAAPIVVPVPESPVSDPHAVETEPAIDTTPQAGEAESVGILNSDPAPVENISLTEPKQLEEQAPEQTEVEKTEVEKTEPEKTELENTKSEEPQPAAAPRKPFFWSAALQTSPSAVHSNESSLSVPPMLRNLQKCQACGFPVSQGRTFCVECEEKQWRGQRVPQPAAAAAVNPAPHEEKEKEKQAAPDPAVAAVVDTPETPVTENLPSAPTEEPAANKLPIPTDAPENISASEPAADNSTLFLSSSQPSESWFGANKYILAALLVVATVIAAIAWLR